MVDFISKEKRSKIMSSIKGKWTKPEIMLHNHLKGMKVKHKMHPKMFGNPDAYLIDNNIIVFVDGCFWHGCPEHGHMPSTDKKFWKAKMDRNKERDVENTKKLKKMGYTVVRIWECQIKGIDSKQLSEFIGF